MVVILAIVPALSILTLGYSKIETLHKKNSQAFVQSREGPSLIYTPWPYQAVNN